MQVNDWFLAAFVDAYEWVMLPNVLGMGLHTDGGRTATKPYVASANYINKMSDYCAGCRYNPKARTGPDACPFNFLYWKQNLPTKTYPICGRPFTWRKKWTRRWNEVVYCSERCRRRRGAALDRDAGGPADPNALGRAP